MFIGHDTPSWLRAMEALISKDAADDDDGGGGDAAVPACHRPCPPALKCASSYLLPCEMHDPPTFALMQPWLLAKSKQDKRLSCARCELQQHSRRLSFLLPVQIDVRLRLLAAEAAGAGVRAASRDVQQSSGATAERQADQERAKAGSCARELG